jgi:UDP-glucose 4-epimerase
MNVLITGGAGYIGSHTLIELTAAGHEPVVVDNLSNSSKESLVRVEKITGKKIPFYELDCMNKAALAAVFGKHTIDCAIHFAGLKAVGESVSQPLRYYRNNIDTTLTLCEVMQDKGVRKLIFSSSASVYGEPERLPLDETCRTGIGISNPYAQTKFMIEQILRDLVMADPTWQITILRYFNPIGAHGSGLIGEDPNDVPNNLLPYIAQVAVGKLEKLQVFGNDYDTPDGTGVRDYIHVVDLARGHLAALKHLPSAGHVALYNLGTGKGASVMELIHAFEQASGKQIPYAVVARRPGDWAAAYADCARANRELDWKAEKTIEDACADAWRWQSRNPNGFRGK